VSNIKIPAEKDVVEGELHFASYGEIICIGVRPKGLIVGHEIVWIKMHYLSVFMILTAFMNQFCVGQLNAIQEMLNQAKHSPHN